MTCRRRGVLMEDRWSAITCAQPCHQAGLFIINIDQVPIQVLVEYCVHRTAQIRAAGYFDRLDVRRKCIDLMNDTSVRNRAHLFGRPLLYPSEKRPSQATVPVASGVRLSIKPLSRHRALFGRLYA